MLAHFIDVGQGSCTLFEFPCGVMLVDTGSADDPKTQPKNTEHLMNYLAAFFERRSDLNKTIDVVIITHAHIDHTYGLPSVFAEYNVRHYVDDGISKTGSGKKQVADVRKLIASKPLATTVRAVTEDELKALPLPAGVTDTTIDSISCADCDPGIRILTGGRPAPDGSYGGPTKFKNPNDNSLVVRVDFGRSSFLVTGDLEEASIKELVPRYAGTNMLDADVYVVGHHGSNNATTKPLLDAVTPKVAVIAVGHWTDGPRFPNDMYNTVAFGHPRSAIVTMLANSISETRSPAIDVQTAAGAAKFEPYRVTKAVYATGWDGDVVVAASLDGRLSVYPKGKTHTQTVDPRGQMTNLASVTR